MTTTNFQFLFVDQGQEALFSVWTTFALLFLGNLLVTRCFAWHLAFLETTLSSFADSWRRRDLQSSAIHRKHGRWRPRDVFPSAWLLMSTVMLSGHAVHGFCANHLNRRHSFHVPTPLFRFKYQAVPFRRPPWANLSMDILLQEPQDHQAFFKPELFDSLFPSSKQGEVDWSPTIPPSKLHLAGFADQWDHYMAQQSLSALPFQVHEVTEAPFDATNLMPSPLQGETSPKQGERLDKQGEFPTKQGEFGSKQGEDVPSLIQFRSLVTYRVPAAGISSTLDSCLQALPTRPTCLAATAPIPFADDHLLRTSRQRQEGEMHGSSDALTFPILLDSGCSVSCSGFRDDFHGDLVLGNFGTITTANGEANIEGFGMIRWTVVTEDGHPFEFMVPGYFSPSIRMRIVSPQDYCRYHKLDSRKIQFGGNADWMHLNLKDKEEKGKQPRVLSQIDSRTRLPFILGEPSTWARPEIQATKTSSCGCHFNSVYDPRNHNLSAAQKALLLDHCRLGHISMKAIQRLYRPREGLLPDFDGIPSPTKSCLNPRIKEQATCDPPMCQACNIAKAKKRNTEAKKTTPNEEVVDGIRAGDLKPGDCFSVDQYESTVRGRRYDTFGREHQSSRYCGGSLFYDHASSRMFVRHQVTLSAVDTLRATQDVLREAMECGVEVKKFRTDNGILTSQAFRQQLEANGQYLERSAPGAHHQNGAAERNIGVVQAMARAMLYHLKIMWPDEFEANLWPMALDYAVFIFNHTPRNGKLSPMEVFCGTRMDCEALKRARVFGCPTYVLDPRLQDGKKIPKWQPRSRLGQFLGFSREHAINVGLIRNVSTGYIGAQFHLVYDEKFQTVTSEQTVDLSETWIDLFVNERDNVFDGHQEQVDGPIPQLDQQWVQQLDVEDENEEAPQPLMDRDNWTDLEEQDVEPQEEAVQPQPAGWFDVEEAEPQQVNPGIGPGQGQTVEATEDDGFQPVRTRRRSPRSRRTGTAVLSGVLLHTLAGPSFGHMMASRDASALVYATLDWESVKEDSLYQQFHGLFSSYLDPETLETLDVEEAFHPFAFAAKVQSEDFPSYRDIINMEPEEKKKWLKSMDEEIQELTERQAFELVPREDVERQGYKVIKSMWAFRRKRRADGTVTRYKSRLVVRGDTDPTPYSNNETFAPVVEWATIRMLFTLGMTHSWSTASIDFANAFTQAVLPKPIYLELPAGFQKRPELQGLVMKITTSLYGDRRAANLWYNKLRKSLESPQFGFVRSTYDPCLFMRHDCALVFYVDDAIIFGRNDAAVQRMLDELKEAGFAYKQDGDFSSYLGVQIEDLPDGRRKLSQPGLTRQLLEVMGMMDCRPVDTPSSSPLHLFRDSEDFDQSFNYRSAIGMLLYLGNNTRPDCAYAINACAQYSINPKKPHGEAVKRICRYLKGTMDEGLILKGSDESELALDLHVDADFAGNYNLDDADDPRSVFSRSGILVTYGSVPVLWRAKRQTAIALSTMESEYQALSTGMRHLVHMRGLLSEIGAYFAVGKTGSAISTIKSTVWEDNRAAQILATTDPPRLTPRSKSMAVKYHWFRSHLSPSSIVIKPVGTNENMADALTKPLPREKFLMARLALSGW